MSSVKKHIYHLLSLSGLLAISGCGAGVGIKDPSGYSTNAQMSVVQDLTPEERTIATRICYAYKSKSSSFRGQAFSGGVFVFALNSKNCVDTRASYNVSSVLKVSSTGMVFEPDSDKSFHKTIQTDESGYLSQLCTKIQNNKAVSNTVTETSTKIQIQFFKDTLDSYTLRYYAPAADGVMKITSSETIKVRTQFDLSSGQILGMDESYTIQQTCGSTDKYSELKQTLSSFSK